MRGKEMQPKLEAAAHDLNGLPNVIDIRNRGLVGAIEFAPRARATPDRRAHEVFQKCWEDSALVGATATAARSRPRQSSKTDRSTRSCRRWKAIKSAA